jgi:hypothetical protein
MLLYYALRNVFHSRLGFPHYCYGFNYNSRLSACNAGVETLVLIMIIILTITIGFQRFSRTLITPLRSLVYLPAKGFCMGPVVLGAGMRQWGPDTGGVLSTSRNYEMLPAVIPTAPLLFN